MADVYVMEHKPILTNRHCKYCGGILDINNVCTSCGHRFFKFSAAVFAIVFLTIMLATVSISAAVKLYTLNKEVKEYKYLYEKKKETISKSKEQTKELNTQIEQLKEKNKGLQYKVDFLDNRIAIVVDNGEKYHTYDCTHVQNCKTFWAYNIEAAEAKGYEPCQKCHNK
ncbi:MAG: hypothetical protein J6N52_04325 [Clostridia bacterium]|nr:hypothetical protein [Clostridia bacterium]